LYIVLQSIEGYVLLPLLQRKAVEVPPVVLIGAQVLMGFTLGGVGLLLAAPLTAAAMVIVKMLYVEETLGDQIHTPEDDISKEDVPPVPGAKRRKHKV
jgi:predicted PurR-regulated permease PerM